MAGVKGKSGRKSKSLETAHTGLSLAESGEDAARYIKKVVKGEEKDISAMRLAACEYVINQLLGKPAQRIQQEIEGRIEQIEVIIRTEAPPEQAEDRD